MLFVLLNNFFNSTYIRLFQKTAFGIDFRLWEVPEIYYDDDDNDDDEDDDDDDDDHNYDVFS